MSQWDQLDELFAEALTLPEAEREVFVAARCGGDAETREELRRMLAARKGMGDFLETNMLDFRGQTFGAYRAMEEVGRGGMSVVYRGQRIDGDFDKRVAIKVILTQVGAAPEARLLAALDHPNIARLLDSGVTALGFRYLVMEYVEGVPCTAYGGAKTEAEKLRLFLQVCHGVQAAHQSLIVHRDLKPDNIIVTAEGTVKLLDFGIAKMLAPSGTQTVGPRAYTIDYASPEQILGYPASTSNDVYSLGVVLCELVGGRLPRELLDAPVDEVVRRIQQEEPAAIPLRGDVAVIARKALRAAASERYESAGALARDIERYLAGAPIEARRPTFGYLAGRFAARHRYAVAATAVAVTALAATSAYALRQAKLAETRFEQVRSLARAVMFELHDAVHPLANSLPARQMIVQRSLSYLDALAADQSAGDEVLIDTARGYLRLAEIQGKDSERASLGQSEQGLERGRQAMAIARRVVGRSPQNREARVALAEALSSVGSSLALRAKPKEAVAALEGSRGIAEELLGGAPADKRMKAMAAEQSLLLGDAYGEVEDPKRAVAMLERSAKLYGELVDADPGNRVMLHNLARAHNYACTLNVRARNKAEALRHNREALRLSRQLYEAEPVRYRAAYASDVGAAGFFESDAGRYDKSVEMYTEQLRLRREMLAANPQDNVTALRVAATLTRICLQQKKAGRAEEAIAAGEEAVGMIRRIRAKDPANAAVGTEFVYALSDLGMAYELGRRPRQACAMGREAAAVFEGPRLNSSLNYTQHAKTIEYLKSLCGKP